MIRRDLPARRLPDLLLKESSGNGSGLRIRSGHSGGIDGTEVLGGRGHPAGSWSRPDGKSGSRGSRSRNRGGVGGRGQSRGSAGLPQARSDGHGRRVFPAGAYHRSARERHPLSARHHPSPVCMARRQPRGYRLAHRSRLRRTRAFHQGLVERREDAAGRAGYQPGGVCSANAVAGTGRGAHLAARCHDLGGDQEAFGRTAGNCDRQRLCQPEGPRAALPRASYHPNLKGPRRRADLLSRRSLAAAGS